MVWKENLLVDGKPESFAEFLDRFEGAFESRDPEEFFRFVTLVFPDTVQLMKGRTELPKHYLFANIQCLRCSLCCSNYQAPPVDPRIVDALRKDGRHDVVEHVSVLTPEGGGVYVNLDASLNHCSFSVQVEGKPYYACRIHGYKRFLKPCRVYLCSKSLPVADIEYSSIDELIEKIGLEAYYRLVETDWGEEFDWSTVPNKTHQPQP